MYFHSAAAARRRPGYRRLVRLHAVLAGAVALGCVGMSRITGAVWFWLGLWGAVVCALVLVAIGWSVGAFVASRSPDRTAAPGDVAGDDGAWWRRVRAVPALAAALAVVAAVLTVQATGATTGGEELSGDLARLVPDTSAALAAGEVPGGGPDGRYLVTFTDPLTLGMHAFGLVNELERDGFDVGMLPAYRASVAEHRVLEPADATAVVHLSVGPDIAAWREVPGAEQVAYVDGRTDAERARYDRLYEQLADGLAEAGLGSMVPQLDVVLINIPLNPEVPVELRDVAGEMMDIGLPTAVFVAPPSARP